MQVQILQPRSGRFCVFVEGALVAAFELSSAAQAGAGQAGVGQAGVGQAGVGQGGSSVSAEKLESFGERVLSVAELHSLVQAFAGLAANAKVGDRWMADAAGQTWTITQG